MKKEFLENLIEDAIQYPFGKPEDKQKNWEDLSKEEQEQWNELAKEQPMQMYMLAHRAFTLKTTKGLPEKMSEMFFNDTYNFLDEDMKNFRASFRHFMEGHKIQSRKSIKRFQTYYGSPE